MEKNKEIPKAVIEAAQKLGNSIRFVGELDGWHVYSIGVVGKNGVPEPTGLPDLLLWNGKTMKNIYGFEALDLLGRFD